MVQVRSLLGLDRQRTDDYFRIYPRPISREWILDRAILDGQPSYVADVAETMGNKPTALQALQLGSQLTVPLMREDVAIGCIVLASHHLDGFNDAHLDLLRTFAEQAVIAIGSVATFRQLQDRTAELTRSVAELQALEEVLRAVNSSLDLETVLATIISRAVALAQADEGLIYEFDPTEQVFVPKAAFGMTDGRVAALRERRIRIGETYLGRSAAARAPIAIDDVRQDASTPEARTLLQGIHAVLAVPLLREDTVVGGLVIRRRTEGAFAPATVALMQTFAAQSVLAIENARLFEAARRARAASDAALADLRRAQDRLVQTEKMASLGQLTAGIAHEIKNPLNFVNNFSELSAELIDELQEALAPAAIDTKLRTEIDDLTALLKSNLEKVVQHGKRADGIVKNMLLHARETSGEMRSVDVNSIVEEALNLAYHGARAEKPGFNITLERNFDPAVGTLELYPQEFTRVLLNIFSNGFYAATRKKTDSGDPGYEPILTVTTEVRPNEVAVRIRDNGIGIPDSVRAKMFEPFFTTKPAGEGTGLGLSLSHDIIVKQHGGNIGVDSRVGEFTEFTVTLPRPNAVTAA
jgi:signal transduction histidine kinase